MSLRWEKLPAESSGWAAAHTLYGVEGRKNDEHDREACASLHAVAGLWELSV